MGSGLILLVIVGAWLAFFVQLALRSNETTNVLGTVDKFHDAMRVLSRRQAAPRPGADAPRRGRPPGPGLDPGPNPGPGTPAPVPTARRTSAVAGPATASALSGAGPEAARRRAEAAARRSTLMAGLAATAVLTLLGAATVSSWLLVPHLLVDLLLVGLVVHVRALALGRAAAEQRIAEAVARERAAARAAEGRRDDRRPAEAVAEQARSVEVRRPVPVVRRPVQIHVAGVPDRMPPRPRPLPGTSTDPLLAPPAAPLPVPAARREAAVPVRGAQGEAWSPVPIPVPTYLSAPPAPRRVVDLTRSAAPVERRASSEPEVGLHDVAPVEPTVEEHRWAVND